MDIAIRYWNHIHTVGITLRTNVSTFLISCFKMILEMVTMMVVFNLLVLMMVMKIRIKLYIKVSGSSKDNLPAIMEENKVDNLNKHYHQ